MDNKNKKSQIFLLVSSVFFIISVIADILYLIVIEHREKNLYLDHDYAKFATAAMFLLIIFILIPAWGAELSLIRSVYKILKHNPIVIVKICYIISAVLAFLVFALNWLVSFDLIHFGSVDSVNDTMEVLMYTLWPGCILSFILGSIPCIKKKSTLDTKDSVMEE